MIEGLKVIVKGLELRSLCMERANFHKERADVYADQLARMEANKIEGMNYTGGDPSQALQDRRDKHADEASELEFIAEHLDHGATYLLHQEDLRKLGISKSRY